MKRREVLAYYERIAPRLLPYIRGRPVAVEWDRARKLHAGGSGERAPSFFFIADCDALLSLIAAGASSFRIWLGHRDNLERPDFVQFLLSRGRASWPTLVDAARRLRRALAARGLGSVVMAAGARELRVLVPWCGSGGFAEARMWALAVAAAVTEQAPEVATLETRMSQRGARVLIDTRSNVAGCCALPPYVLCADGVATPLTWKELTPELDVTALTPEATLARLARAEDRPLDQLLDAVIGADSRRRAPAAKAAATRRKKPKPRRSAARG